MDIQTWQLRESPTADADSPAVAIEPPTDEIQVVSSEPAIAPLTVPETTALASEEPTPAPVQPTRAARIATLDWEALATEVRTCTACGLHAGRKQAVFGVGKQQARWMVIGEAPGADEDRLGEPFVGRSGKLLDLMLEALSLKRETVFIANVIKCRPPQNRDPTAEESSCCRPFLERQVALVQPRIILAVGRIAAQNLLNTQQPVGKLRNRVHRFGNPGVPLVVTYHPAYLLRSPREKRKAWQDLQLARSALLDDGAGPMEGG